MAADGLSADALASLIAECVKNAAAEQDVPYPVELEAAKARAEAAEQQVRELTAQQMETP